MSCYASFVSLILFAFLSILRSSAQSQYLPTYLSHVCLNSTTYTRNSEYSSNLEELLSSFSKFSSDNPIFSLRFYQTATGQNPDVVYGLFLCRGDISPEVCRDCVVDVANNTRNRCPERKAGLIWYEECMIRYADQNIFTDISFRNGTNGILLRNTSNVPQDLSDRFRDTVVSLMNVGAAEAADSSTRFSVNKWTFTSSLTLYGLNHCLPDLPRQACLDCLQTAIEQLPTDRVGGRLLLPSCSSRYELFPFYNETAFSTVLPPPGKGGKTYVIALAVIVPIAALCLLCLVVYKVRAKRMKKMFRRELLTTDRDDMTSAGSLQFDFKEIEAATDMFSSTNKLGQGGFGQVYKGTFPSGVQVAVKRLSTTSGQGDKEFKNEVVVVAKLQHKNLVKLLGFCMEGSEKILVYEYVPNKSLDYFLFDSMMRSQLDWTMRYKIIGGIARGILYLHQDSRLTIIHRDLKAGNILLDVDMNPKIADFGMARIFGIDQTEANTRKVVGTYGYMSPEYAMYGQFSMKSDVYSFGVLILEIISGKRNSSFYHMDENGGNLITYTWTLWRTGSPLDIMDPSFGENYQTNEISRCIHIALLCVQEEAEDRPTMSAIVQMLTTSSITLPRPRPPGCFFRSRDEQEGKVGPSMDRSVLCSVDDGSITQVVPR